MQRSRAEISPPGSDERPDLAGRVRGLLPADPAGRTLALATLANTIGNGAFFTISAIYFTHVIGLSPVQVGVGLTVAGLAGLFVGVPAGHADVRGPREVLVALTLLLGVASLGYVVASSFAAFLAAAVVVTALAVDTRAAYTSVIVLDALTFAATGLIVLRLPHVPPTPVVAGGPRLPVLRDRPFLAITALHGVLAMHYALIEVAVPLWVVRETSAPRWVVAALLLANTVSVVLLQVRVSRSYPDVPSGVRAISRSGLLIAAACVIFALAKGAPAGVAVAILLAGALVHVAGELLQAAGSWAISFGLAPEGRQGQYQGLFSSGFAASSMLAPVVLTALCIQWGRPGWLLLGVVFAVAGGAFVPVVRWAERHRGERAAAVSAG